MKNNPKANKVYIRIDPETALNLSKLGWMHEIPINMIKLLVDHANVCQKWWIERDEEDEL